MGDFQSSNMVTQSFKDREAAERAYQSLRDRGYSDKDINVIMSDDTRKKYYTHTEKIEKTEMGNKALEGAGVGGAVGGAIGATIMAVIAAGAAVTVPGVGLLIAGPVAGALAGGATGAAAGGLVGTLVGAGIPEERAKLYEKDIRDGGVVLGIRPRDDADARYFESEWPMEAQRARR